jgi:hypothetical protein
MPPTQSKDQRRFDEALKTYLTALETSRQALSSAIHRPSQGSEEAYRLASKDEKKARKEYRKVTKKLASRIEGR